MLQSFRNLPQAASIAMLVGVAAAVQPSRDASLLDTRQESVNSVTSWVSVMILCFAVRFARTSKVVVAHKLISVLLMITLVIAACFTIANSLQFSSRPGTSISHLAKGIPMYSGAARCIAQLFFILGIFFSKISTCAVLMALAPTKVYRLPTLVVEVTILIWTISSLYTFSRNDTAEPSSIAPSFGYGYAKIDVLTDIAIMVFPIGLIWKLQLSLQKKITICLAFGFRSFAIGCTLLRRTSAGLDLRGDVGSVTREGWVFSLSIILQLFFSALAACIPHLRPFRDSVQAACFARGSEESEREVKQVKVPDTDVRLSRSNAIEYLKSDHIKSRGDSPRP